MNQSGKISWGAIVTVILVAVLIGRGYLKSQRSSEPVPLKPPQVQEIQYQLEDERGLVNIKVKNKIADIFLGVGMITGVRSPGKTEAKGGFTGSLNFEMEKPMPGVQAQVDRVRFVEKMGTDQEQSFDADGVYDDKMKKGAPPQVLFVEEKGKFPVIWKSENDGYIYFVFSKLPAEAVTGHLVLNYSVLFPGKRHPASYESRLSVQRKIYTRTAQDLQALQEQLPLDNALTE